MKTAEKKIIFDERRVYAIISRAGLNSEQGEIGPLMGDENPIELTLWGRCAVLPQLVNEVDRKVWIEKWRKLATEPMFYDVGPVCGGKVLFKQRIETVDYDIVEESVARMAELIERHHAEACSYNKNIAEPYISERKGLIDKL